MVQEELNSTGPNLFHLLGSLGLKPKDSSNLPWPGGVKLPHGKGGGNRRCGGVCYLPKIELEQQAGAIRICHEKQTHPSKSCSLETREDARVLIERSC